MELTRQQKCDTEPWVHSSLHERLAIVPSIGMVVQARLPHRANPTDTRYDLYAGIAGTSAASRNARQSLWT